MCRRLAASILAEKTESFRVSASLTRRVLFARLRGVPVAIRPPGAVDEERFVESCRRCNACITACSTGIISRGHGGFPAIDFAKGACTFCGACAAACKDGCFTGARDWSLKAVISSVCVEPKGVACRMCESACDENALRFRPMLGGRSQPVVDIDNCTGCGACAAPCPVHAISFTPLQEAAA